jgi:hypothetical protein
VRASLAYAGISRRLKDTDSVMIHFPACTLQQAADHGERLSKFFDTKILKSPQSLAFEKARALFKPPIVQVLSPPSPVLT